MTSRIEGVELIQLQVFSDMRGRVQRIWREDDPAIGSWKIAEAYLSVVYPKAVKAWHRHKQMTLRYVCVRGAVRVGLYDNRPGSPSKGVTMTVLLSDGRAPTRYSFSALVIPPMVWNGFRVWEDADEGTILNLPDLPHQPDEIERVPPDHFPELGRFWGEYEEGG